MAHVQRTDNGRCLVCAMLHTVNGGFNIHLFSFVWVVRRLIFYGSTTILSLSAFIVFQFEYSSIELELAGRRQRPHTVTANRRLTMDGCMEL